MFRTKHTMSCDSESTFEKKAGHQKGRGFTHPGPALLGMKLKGSCVWLGLGLPPSAFCVRADICIQETSCMRLDLSDPKLCEIGLAHPMAYLFKEASPKS